MERTAPIERSAREKALSAIFTDMDAFNESSPAIISASPAISDERDQDSSSASPVFFVTNEILDRTPAIFFASDAILFVPSAISFGANAIFSVPSATSSILLSASPESSKIASVAKMILFVTEKILFATDKIAFAPNKIAFGGRDNLFEATKIASGSHKISGVTDKISSVIKAITSVVQKIAFTTDKIFSRADKISSVSDTSFFAAATGSLAPEKTAGAVPAGYVQTTNKPIHQLKEGKNNV
jgi:hypothetical protein